MIKFLKREKTLKAGKITLMLFLSFLVSGVSIKINNESVDSNVIQAYTPNNTEKVSDQDKSNEKVTEAVKEEISQVDSFIQTNEEALRFFANVFDMNYDDVIVKIREANTNGNSVIQNNIGYLVNANNEVYDFGSVDRGILEFFLYLENTYPEMVTYDYQPYTSGNSDYVAALVEYFSYLYPNVDHNVMLSIGAAESGYYTSSSMLYKNNVYGGMSSGGLITYKNIEYGVMSYIKKMSESYYAKGLNTIESIGYVFCPKIENGVKTVSSHWLNLVNKAMNVYTEELHYVSVAQLNDLLYNM